MDEITEEEEFDISPRMFVNNLDTFLSGSLAQHLATCKPGLALSEDEMEEEENEVANLVEQESPGTTNLTGYRVVGTLSSPNVLNPPNYVEATLKVSKHPTFEEEEHAKRKPHPLYRRQFEAEQAIYNLGKKHKRKLAIYVIASGIPYGGREDIFEQFFLSISRKFSTGEVRNLNEFDLLRLRDVSKVQVDQLMMDIVINTPTLDEDLQIPWQCEDGIIANIDRLAKEYLEAKNIKPLRILIIGAPFAGKSTIAMALARHYGLHYIHITPVLMEAYLRLVS
ncbi:unnamed protein product [Rodentolepis nana]|uniref:Adenylate kinase 7 n=1 Tax=Rodentolepis nana TaxID=102285 RepID=A0A158QIM7_RODNA|nr:unnamed protein product [Rodentolepis nana]